MTKLGEVSPEAVLRLNGLPAEAGTSARKTVVAALEALGAKLAVRAARTASTRVMDDGFFMVHLSLGGQAHSRGRLGPGPPEVPRARHMADVRSFTVASNAGQKKCLVDVANDYVGSFGAARVLGPCSHRTGAKRSRSLRIGLALINAEFEVLLRNRCLHHTLRATRGWLRGQRSIATCASDVVSRPSLRDSATGWLP